MRKTFSYYKVEIDINRKEIPVIQVYPLKINEIVFQKRKTCRTGEEGPAQIGFVGEGLT
jgi:hypothetical protein